MENVGVAVLQRRQAGIGAADTARGTDGTRSDAPTTAHQITAVANKGLGFLSLRLLI